MAIDGYVRADADGMNGLLLLTDDDLAERARKAHGSPLAKICAFHTPQHLAQFLEVLARSGAMHVAFDHFSPGQAMKSVPIIGFINELKGLP